MLSEAPHASWNPALRPNSIADLPQSTPKDLPSAETSPALLATDDVLDDAHNKSLGPDAWFPNYDTGDGALEEEAPDAPSATELPGQPDIADATVQEPSDASSTSSKHTNRMSFARTVSHEVNWMDDDDPEWNLPRTATDPFKAMAPSNRTNSFPVVPPLAHQSENELDRPVPFNEAEEVIRELEQDDIADSPREFSPLSDTPEGESYPNEVEGLDASHQSIGGELREAAEEASEARYTEGVPLISSTEDNQPQNDSHEDERDPFGDDPASEEDDFFSSVRVGGVQPDEDVRPTIERKSTRQVLDAMDVGLAKESFAALEESAEEVDSTWEPTQPNTANEVPSVPTVLTSDAGVRDDEQPKAETGEDLDAKWKEMFADEDEFLSDELLPDDSTETKEVDPTAFIIDDDEGFLDDSPEEPLADSSEPLAANAPEVPQTGIPNGRYLPPSTPTVNAYSPAIPTTALPPAHPYLPAVTPITQFPAVTSYGIPASNPPAPTPYGYGAQRPKLEEKKAQSFADKAKGGYTSPYDLPMEVVKPKKRASMQNLQRPPPTPNALSLGLPPPRSTSLMAHLPSPPSTAGSSMPPPNLSQAPQSQPKAHKPPPLNSKARDSFFEELPVVAKPRPVSRQSHTGLHSPAQTSPYGPPPQSGPPPMNSQTVTPQAPPSTSQPVPDFPKLVAPARVNPYASLPSNAGLSPAVPAVTSSRYSPAPPSTPQTNGPVPAAAPARYSPAPPGARQPSAGYTPSATASAPPILPHQPRTSSPLAHFEISHEKSRSQALGHVDGSLTERRSTSSLYDARLQRVPSLPPTQEVEEEGTSQVQSPEPITTPQQPSPPMARHNQLPHRPRQTPPPSSLLSQATLSPPKRTASSYSPLAASPEFAPPPRSQTQSPGALFGNRNGKPVESIPRPSSVHGPAPPRTAAYSATINPSAATATTPFPTEYSRPRGFSQNLSFVPPTDGRENDTLHRWRGAPLISWGVGGTVVTMFPKNVPRYGMNQSVPMVVRSPGDVKVKHVKDILPLDEVLAKFPGPLKGKSKKKETITWLSTGIESLERALPNNPFGQQNISHDDKRAMERVLLWKILRVFVEHDGVLEGNQTVEKAVRDIMSPNFDAPGMAQGYVTATGLPGLNGSSATTMQSDTVDSSTVEEIRRHLLNGEGEKAVWAAVDKRLWGHALLLANALAPTLYTQVAQEFVKKEVNFPGHNNESLAALYEVLSGNHEESVDELVPVHARAGFQLVAKDSVSKPSKDAMEGLDKWRETLSLILSNRSTDDARAITSLGNLLSGYGRAEAAHICFLFARSQSVFGGLDDPKSNFVLVGSDHKRQAEQFAKEIEPLLLSEVYEYGQSLAGSASISVTNPHLAAYKFQHALALAEYGFRDKALQYCEVIGSAITAQTRRSPYHHPILENAVEDLAKRLKQAPKEESNSWIPKPSMNKVSDTVWNRFNKFVAGDDAEGSGHGSPKEGEESGPFARVAGGTPTISRSPSTSNLETFGVAVPNYGMPNPLANGLVAASASAPPTRAASRYAPAAAQPVTPGINPYESSSAYVPRSSMERTSSELNRGSFELARQSSDIYSPNRTSSPAQGGYSPYQGAGLGLSQESPYTPVTQHDTPTQPQQSPQASGTTPGYTPLGYSGAPMNGGGQHGPSSSQETNETSATNGYQPISYEYDSPSFTPYQPPAAEENDVKHATEGGSSYEPPSYQPYGYEPPSFELAAQSPVDNDSSDESKPKPKKKGIMYDDEDDFSASKPAEKSKEERDRENAELFRKAAEEDEKRAAEAKQGKKGGWGFTGWFGGSAKKETMEAASANKPIRAKLGEANSFYYDPEQKRWVNKNAGPEDNAAKKSAAPPPRAGPRSATSSPAPPMATPGPATGGGDAGRASAPPAGPPRSPMMPLSSSPSLLPADGSMLLGPPSGLPPMMRSVSNTSNTSGPPSRPTTSLSNSSSIDDLLAAAGPRKAGAKKPRKSARYVDIMTK